MNSIAAMEVGRLPEVSNSGRQFLAPDVALRPARDREALAPSDLAASDQSRRTCQARPPTSARLWPLSLRGSLCGVSRPMTSLRGSPTSPDRDRVVVDRSRRILLRDGTGKTVTQHRQHLAPCRSSLCDPPPQPALSSQTFIGRTNAVTVPAPRHRNLRRVGNLARAKHDPTALHPLGWSPSRRNGSQSGGQMVRDASHRFNPRGSSRAPALRKSGSSRRQRRRRPA